MDLVKTGIEWKKKIKKSDCSFSLIYFFLVVSFTRSSETKKEEKDKLILLLMITTNALWIT